MNLDALNGNSDKLYKFLQKWAFNVDRDRFDRVLEKMKECSWDNYGEKHKQGWFFKILLFRLDRLIDWKFAQEMEIDFESNGK